MHVALNSSSCFLFVICRSGTDEDFTEKNQLLTELAELLAEKESLSQKQRVDMASEIAHASQMRADACKRLSQKSGKAKHDEPDESQEEEEDPLDHDLLDRTDGTTVAKPKKRRSYGYGSTLFSMQEQTASIFSYLEKNKKKEQSVEERRLLLEERRLQVEEKERERKYQREKEEREAQRKKEEEDRKERLAVMNILERLADKLS